MFKISQEIGSNEFVGFIINSDYYCFNINWVQEMTGVPPISKIPNVPHYIEGSINLRGKIIRIVNLRRWLRLPWKKIDLKSKILVLDINSKLFGVIVEDIYEVFTIEEEQKYELPYLLMRQPETEYVNSIIQYDDHIFLELIPEKIQDS